MSKANKLTTGDRIAYAAKFLRNTGQFTGPSGARRGTFASYWSADPQFARVHWDDEAQMIASKQGQFGDPEYCEDVRQNGSLVHSNNIAKVGSPRFALNDL
jgi:hypothetical protein